MILGYGRAAKFAVGAGGKEIFYEDVFSNVEHTVAWSGVGYHNILRHLEKNNLDFYYIDTGYIGNKKLKTYKRITKNNINDDRTIIDRPNDRLALLNFNDEIFKRGNNILIVPPDQKVLTCWDPNIKADEWITDVKNKLSQYTDRKIVIRERIKNRADRLVHNTFLDALRQDIHAVIAWSSNCAVESVIHGVPVVSLGPTATKQVSPFTLEQIDNVPDLDHSLIERWLRHLSYCQFTDEEMVSGLAFNLLNQ